MFVRNMLTIISLLFSNPTFQTFPLRILFVFFLPQLHHSGEPQYDIETYDASPWPTGEPVTKSNALESCKKIGRRLCTNRDLEAFARNGRYFCELAWAYNIDSNSIGGFMVSSKNNDCLRNKYVGVFPSIRSTNLNLGSERDRFYCHINKEDTFWGKKYECSGPGYDYKGNVYHSEHGELCQDWNAVYPNEPSEFEKNIDNFNFCRNFIGSDKKRPWCYLAHRKKWSYCNIYCRKYGTYDHCSLTLYLSKNLKGKSCTINVGKGHIEREMIGTTNSRCSGVFQYFRSFEIKGSFCQAKVYMLINKEEYCTNRKNLFKLLETETNMRKEYTMYLADYIVVYDHSPDVILANKSMQIDLREMGYRQCYDYYVDEAEFFYDMVKKKRIGFVLYAENLRLKYTIDNSQKQGHRQAWCCNDEFIKEIAINSRLKPVVDSDCNGYRHASFDFRGFKSAYHIPRRMCTVADIKAHLAVTSCYVKKSETDIVSYRISGSYVCCCDGDCFPNYYLCSKNEHCCSLVCNRGVCVPIEDTNTRFMYDFEEKLSLLQKMLIVLVFLYILSLLMRICCPQRRLLSKHVKVD